VETLRVERIALYDLSYEELEAWLTDRGEPSFRAQQVWRWLYQWLRTEFGQMSNLPKALRAELAGLATISVLEPLAEQWSDDGETLKVLFRLRDGHAVESVLMIYPPGGGPGGERRTVCVSTQVGCAMGCVFCATGQPIAEGPPLARNLTAGEIVAQVLHFDRTLREQEGREPSERQVTNIVLMGMGEPLANYDATWKALRTLADDKGYNLGARRITLSTVGLVPGIRRMAEEPLQINLAVSLHAPNDELRDRLVPINRRYPLDELMAAVRGYLDRTSRRVTFEYALMDGVNDSRVLAQELAALLGGLLCHVNLIPMNPTSGSFLRGSSPEVVHAFQAELERWGIPVTVRRRRGVDIQAGCGQLRQRMQAG
jgi:23S rRNA (adenine2503-C2)-methyltransferase